MALSAKNEEPISRSHGWYAVTLLTVAYALSLLDRQLIAVLVEPIKAQFGVSDTQIGLLQGFSFAVLYSLVGIPLGRLADSSVHRVRLAAAGIILWSAMTTLSALVRNFGTLFACRVGVGIGEASLSPAAVSLIGDYFGRSNLGRAIGVYQTGSYVGSGVALSLGSAVLYSLTMLGPIELGAGVQLAPWQMTLLICGLPGVLLGLLVCFSVREPPRASDAPARPELLRDGPSAWDFILKERKVAVPLLAAMGFIAAMQYAFFAWVPTLFTRRFGWEIREIGVAFGAIALVTGATVPVLAGWMHDRAMRSHGIRGTFGVALGFTALQVGYMIAPILDSPYAALTFLALGVTGSTALGPVLNAMLQVVTPGHLRGQVMAIAIFCGVMFGYTLGPLGIGIGNDFVFRDELSIHKSLVLMAVTCIPVIGFALSFGWMTSRRLPPLLSAAH